MTSLVRRDGRNPLWDVALVGAEWLTDSNGANKVVGGTDAEKRTDTLNSGLGNDRKRREVTL
jgi:hypothetical protein